MNELKRPLRIIRERAALVVIDIQDRLFPTISGNELLVKNAVRLIRGCQVLKVPVLVTEQYPKGLGRTLPEIASAVGQSLRFEKTAFSACGAEGIESALEAGDIKDVIVCGIETHVCVSQTCLDFLEHGLRCFVVSDAASSRNPNDHRLALERMRDSGAIITSTEMMLFELLRQAGTPEFKAVQALIK
jgi:nicotinamidase-related amidase